MFAVGVTLVPGRLHAACCEQPRAVIAGLIGQLILLPVFAWGLAVAWQLPPEMAVGDLVILGACPGGASSALITHLARERRRCR